jgi:hypothetical protein
MVEQRQTPENLSIGGSNVPSVKIQAPKEGLEGLKEMLSSVFSKGDKAARAALGPAAAPVEGLLSLFDLRDVPAALSSAGKDLQSGVTEGDPKAMLAGVLATALVGAENVPGGNVPSRAVNRVLRKSPLEKISEESIFYREPAIVPEAPLKIAAKYKDKDNFLLDEEGNPVVVYHSTDSTEPIKEFKTAKELSEIAFDPKNKGYNFMSTSLSPETAGSFGLSAKGEAGARLIPGMVKANKTFDYQNKKHIKELEKILDKEDNKRIKSIERMKLSKNSTILQDVKNRIKKDRELLKEGNFNIIESAKVQDILKKLGYDSFTTYERKAKNIMLLEPEKQFIPLFDVEKTSTLGYKKGGSVVERNPYNYTAKAI